jgi:hypothetical protein
MGDARGRGWHAESIVAVETEKWADSCGWFGAVGRSGFAARAPQLDDIVRRALGTRAE